MTDPNNKDNQVIDWENPFKPEDFESSELMSMSITANNSSEDKQADLATKIVRHVIGQEMADIANARFREIVAQGKRVWTPEEAIKYRDREKK